MGADERRHPHHRHLRQHGRSHDAARQIGAIVVGADRIAANGDVANKIGTYTVAILAKEHASRLRRRADFYGRSSHARRQQNSHRAAQRQRGNHIGGRQMTPDGVEIENPAFDVTRKIIAAIITERGIARAPYKESLSELATPRLPS